MTTKSFNANETYYLMINGFQAGKVNIYHQTEEIYISVIEDCGLWGGSYSCAYYAKLALGEFSQDNSKIPWTKIQNSIHNYTIKLCGVKIENHYDRLCENWFKSLGCKIIH